MFSQKKKNTTWIYVCLGLLAAILFVVALISVLGNTSEEEALQTNLERKAEEPGRMIDEEETGEFSESTQNTENPDTQMEEKETPDTGKEENSFHQSYYLVKSDNNVVKIYFSDETGNLVQLEETGIVYEILSEADQKRFAEGIKLDTRDDLNKLIMNYES